MHCIGSHFEIDTAECGEFAVVFFYTNGFEQDGRAHACSPFPPDGLAATTNFSMALSVARVRLPRTRLQSVSPRPHSPRCIHRLIAIRTKPSSSKRGQSVESQSASNR